MRTLLLFLLFVLAAAPQEFWIAGTLRDGKDIAGTVVADAATLEITTGSGEVVTLRVARNPGWTTAETVLDAAWSDERQCYVLRALNWTGEARRLRGALPVVGEDRRTLVVPLDSVTRLVISHSRKQ